MKKVEILSYNSAISWPVLSTKHIRFVLTKIARSKDPLFLMQFAAQAVVLKLNNYLKKFSYLNKKPRLVCLIGPSDKGEHLFITLQKINLNLWECSFIVPWFIDKKKTNCRNISITQFVAQFLSIRDTSCYNAHISDKQKRIRNIMMSVLTTAVQHGCHISSQINVNCIKNADVILDALLDTAQTNTFCLDSYLDLIRLVNKNKRKDNILLSLDVPSGLNGDTGRPLLGKDTIIADETLTFIALKPGLLTGLGKNCVGRISVAPLNLNMGCSINRIKNNIDELSFYKTQNIITNSTVLFQQFIPQRSAAAHKGESGTTCIFGGNDGMLGAVILSGRASLYTGSGKTHLFILSKKNPYIDFFNPELLLHSGRFSCSNEISKSLAHINPTSFAIGPGLGHDCYAETALNYILEASFINNIPAIFDADALNIMARNKKIYQKKFQQILLKNKVPYTIFTPHPGEAAKLLSTNIHDIEKDRLKAARTLANHWSSIILLKGSGSIIAWPNSHKLTVLNTTGNCGLSFGGSGDLLTGIIGSLLAQKVKPLYATLAACYWHGLASEITAAKGFGPIGLTAKELLFEIRILRNKCNVFNNQ